MAECEIKAWQEWWEEKRRGLDLDKDPEDLADEINPVAGGAGYYATFEWGIYKVPMGQTWCQRCEDIVRASVYVVEPGFPANGSGEEIKPCRVFLQVRAGNCIEKE